MTLGTFYGPTLVPIGPSRSQRASALLNPHALDHEGIDYTATPCVPTDPRLHSYIGSRRYNKLLQNQIFKLQASHQVSGVTSKWKSAHLTTLLHLINKCLDSPSDIQLAAVKSEVEQLCLLQQRLNRRIQAQKQQELSTADAAHEAWLNTQDSLGSWICLDTPGKASPPKQEQPQLSVESSHVIEQLPAQIQDKPKLIKPQQGTLLVPAPAQATYKTLDDVGTLEEASPEVHGQVAKKKESTKRKQTSLKKPKGAMVINATKDWTFR